MTVPGRIPDLIQARFGPAPGPLRAGFGPDPGGFPARPGQADYDGLARLLDRRSCRDYAAREVPEALVRLLLAAGLSAPTKSDLQQADVVWVRDQAILIVQGLITDALLVLSILAIRKRFRPR